MASTLQNESRDSDQPWSMRWPALMACPSRTTVAPSESAAVACSDAVYSRAVRTPRPATITTDRTRRWERLEARSESETAGRSSDTRVRPGALSMGRGFGAATARHGHGASRRR